MKVIYIAGKYTAPSRSGISKNIRRAELASIRLWRKGWAVITPHLNTAHFEKYESSTINYKTWINGYLEILKRCDFIFMLKNWKDSPGAQIEYNLARKIGIDILFESDGYPEPC